MSYMRRLASKYLISGPAPLGRILNYTKRIKNGHYRTSWRGPIGSGNLDNWTVCLMVGLGLINEPKGGPSLSITLTKKGEKIYRLIQGLPNFPDHPRQSRSEMRKIKNDLLKNNPRLYRSLKDLFLDSDVIRNLLIFLQHKNIEILEKQRFGEFGRIFGIDEAWFNRVPSLLQIAEFCGILRDEGTIVRVISGISIKTQPEIIKEHIREAKRNRGEEGELDQEEENYLHDLPKNLSPKKRQIVVMQIQRDGRIAAKLKILYNNKCQICESTFAKLSGGFYSESHHTIPLGQKGSDEVKNILILCPTCHKQLHYAKIEYGKKWNNKWPLKINGIKKVIKYHPTHFRAITEPSL